MCLAAEMELAEIFLFSLNSEAWLGYQYIFHILVYFI